MVGLEAQIKINELARKVNCYQWLILRYEIWDKKSQLCEV